MRLKKTAAGHCLTIMASRFFIISLAGLFALPVLAAEGTVEQRLKRVEQLLNNQNLLQMYTTQQALKRELSDLRGQIELLNHEMEQIKKGQNDIYLDLDQRIQEVEKDLTSLRSIPPVGTAPALTAGDGATSGMTAVPSAPAVPTLEAPEDVATSGQESLGEQESYQASLGLLKNGEYQEAINAFQVFLISYPSSDYASNAQYWMAEAHYVLKEFQAAIENFRKVITQYPGSRKEPDAHLKIGFSFYELQDWANAQKALEKVMSDYPSSTAARLAERRLQKMKLEGHI